MEVDGYQTDASSKTTEVFGKVKKTSGNRLSFMKGALARHVTMDELSSDDIIIAVMGPTGSGKSSFINILAGLDPETGVGHSLESCTNQVSHVRLSVPDLAFSDLVFVDTPGFNDTHKSDVDILKMVADWLKSTYAKGILLKGLLYFHRISDNRMAGTPLKNLRMFEKLCGTNNFQNVILATTMWDVIDEETGVAREKDLISNYWKDMLARNSKTKRFLRTPESAVSLIDPFIEEGNKRSSVLLQQEMVDMRQKLPETSAGQKLFSTMEALVRQREDLLRRLRDEMKRSDGDEMILDSLQDEHDKLKMNVEWTVNEMRRLKLPLGKRLGKMTLDFFSTKLRFFFLKRTKPSKDQLTNRNSIGQGSSRESTEMSEGQHIKNNPAENASTTSSNEPTRTQASTTSWGSRGERGSAHQT